MINFARSMQAQLIEEMEKEFSYEEIYLQTNI